jgi:osmoprotectant transport system ATP-binding protein
MREIAIQFRGVSYQLQQRSLVHNLNLSVFAGDTLVLLGRSGCGKTTTLKLINRLLEPTQGEVLVGGITTTAWDAMRLRRQIGYVIQDIGLFPHFTLEQNVGLVPKLVGWSKPKIRDRAHQLLDLVGLPASQFADRYPHQLSGGQRQRVGVARALAADPPILLMDEPFGALDPITRRELQAEFQQLQQQLHKTTVLVTHDVREAFLMASQIGLMQAGQLAVLGTPHDLLNSQEAEAHAFLQGLTGSDLSVLRGASL